MIIDNSVSEAAEPKVVSVKCRNYGKSKRKQEDGLADE